MPDNHENPPVSTDAEDPPNSSKKARQRKHSVFSDPASHKDMVSRDFLLKPPSGTAEHRKFPGSKNMPEGMKAIVEEALATRIANLIAEKPVAMNRKGKAVRPAKAKTKEDMDREMKELLWKINIFGRIQDRFADLEFKAFHTRVVLSDFCVHLALILIPLLALTLIWDLVGARYLHIPHLTTLRHPGLTLPVHFIAMPAAMYGYMLLVLHQDRNRLLRWSVFCIIAHLILLILRCTIEVMLNGSRPESHIRYEKYNSAANNISDAYENRQAIVEHEYSLGLGWPTF